MIIVVALRLLRTREALSQTAASRREGAPEFRTLSKWETGRKTPSLPLLTAYLGALGFDFHDLQDALDANGAIGSTGGRVAALEAQLDRTAVGMREMESRLASLEARD